MCIRDSETPNEDLVARLEVAAFDRLVGERGAGIMQNRARVAESVGGFRLRQLGVHHGDGDALLDGVIDERVEGSVAGMAHDSDAIGLGGDGLLAVSYT